jgi:hypothetical protein
MRRWKDRRVAQESPCPDKGEGSVGGDDACCSHSRGPGSGDRSRRGGPRPRRLVPPAARLPAEDPRRAPGAESRDAPGAAGPDSGDAPPPLRSRRRGRPPSTAAPSEGGRPRLAALVALQPRPLPAGAPRPVPPPDDDRQRSPRGGLARGGRPGSPRGARRRPRGRGDGVRAGPRQDRRPARRRTADRGPEGPEGAADRAGGRGPRTRDADRRRGSNGSRRPPPRPARAGAPSRLRRLRAGDPPLPPPLSRPS